MMRKAELPVRWILSAGIVYGAYTETGFWTALALSLSVIQIEVIAMILRRNS